MREPRDVKRAHVKQLRLRRAFCAIISLTQNPATERENDLLKIQQERENELLKIQQEREKDLFKIQQESRDDVLKIQQQREQRERMSYSFVV